MRISFKELTTSQLDMAITGQLLAFTNTSPGTSTSKKLPHERKSNSPSPISLTCMVKNMHGQKPYSPDPQPLQLSRHMPYRGVFRGYKLLSSL